MKEYIIHLTKGKKAILTIPLDCSPLDLKQILESIKSKIHDDCKHEKPNYNLRTRVAKCDICGKILN